VPVKSETIIESTKFHQNPVHAMISPQTAPYDMSSRSGNDFAPYSSMKIPELDGRTDVLYNLSGTLLATRIFKIFLEYIPTEIEVEGTV
jgi:hypothetical protein